MNPLDLFLHLDRWLGIAIQRLGVFTYALLFVVIFCETGFVVTPFLPGDSLLFAAGTFAAVGSLNVFWLFVILAAAAVIGDTVNYWTGRTIGLERFIGRGTSFFRVRPEHLQKTQTFFERHGAKTIVLARFVPIVRTVAPFVAGVGHMPYSRFLAYNVVGGVAWVGLFTLGGFFFGTVPAVKDHFSLAIIGIIVISILPGLVEYVRSVFRRRGRESS